MSIKECAASIDFSYEMEEANTDEDVFDIKFHQTDQYGKTISICGSIGVSKMDDSEYISLPAELFAEVVDFLRSKKYISNGSQPKTSASGSTERQENMKQMSSTALPIPSLFNDTESRKTVEPTSPAVVATDVSDESGMDILPVQSLMSEFVNADLNNLADQNEDYEDVEMEDIRDKQAEEIKDAIEERKKAQENAAKSKKKSGFRQVAGSSKDNMKKRIQEAQRQNEDVEEV